MANLKMYIPLSLSYLIEAIDFKWVALAIAAMGLYLN